MKRFIFFGALFALLIGALFVVNHRRQQTPAYLLRHYPPSANLTYMIAQHSRPPSAEIFRSNWFFDGSTTSSTMGCALTEQGAQECQTSAGNMALNAGLSRIAPAQFARFQTLVRALPPGAATAPPTDRLLLVSFRDGANWTTRLYDRARLPPQIIEVAAIGGFNGLSELQTDKSLY